MFPTVDGYVGDLLRVMVPQTYGEATKFWGLKVVDCESHEWDNRTTAGNTIWLLDKLYIQEHAIPPNDRAKQC